MQYDVPHLIYLMSEFGTNGAGRNLSLRQDKSPTISVESSDAGEAMLLLWWPIALTVWSVDTGLVSTWTNSCTDCWLALLDSVGMGWLMSSTKLFVMVVGSNCVRCGCCSAGSPSDCVVEVPVCVTTMATRLWLTERERSVAWLGP